MINSELVDTDVTYCDVPDVERWVRAELGVEVDFTDVDVDSAIESNTEEIDTRTRQSWRSRRVTGFERTVQLDAREELRDYDYSRTHKSSRRGNNVSPGYVRLPHHHITEIEEIVVILGTSTSVVDDDSLYRLNNRSGDLYLNLRLFSGVENETEHAGANMWSHTPKVSVTYTFGRDSIPADISKAAAMKTAADILGSDVYGSVSPSGEGGLSISEAVQNLESSADEIISNYEV